MRPTPDHERALLLVLREGDGPAKAFEALLAHPDVQAYTLPPPWTWERAGVDLLAALPDLATVRREDLDRVLDALLRLHTPAALDALCRREWRAVDEQVRSFYLKRPALETMASIVRLAPKSAELEPPPEFVEAQVILNPFEMQYRLRREGKGSDPRAPEEEGSLVLYPFDPANQVARREAQVGSGSGPVVEAFAYAASRDRHRAVLEDVAHGRGWRVVDSPPA